ncbi:MAG: hypothetical protein HC855_00325 [Rhizobiales bacterium]|nr:hypothetical protein [Hyphomicrobiales bacterium]
MAKKADIAKVQKAPAVAMPAYDAVPSPLAPAVVAQPVEQAKAAPGSGRPGRYALLCAAFAIAGIASVFTANRMFALEMYDEKGMAPAVAAFAEGKNYAVFDLNLNIRKLRDKQIAQMKDTPDVVIFGASHWQEAHSGLVRHKKMYNSHIHRDYWEDLLAVPEMWVRNGKLPKQVIISIRDNQFVPVGMRNDFLWEPGIPYYRQMAERLGLPVRDFFKTLPWQRMRERTSLAMLFSNVTRWYNAEAKPQATKETKLDKLDILLPDGSIIWSREHMALFTRERTIQSSREFADQKRNSPPVVDEAGVAQFEKLLAFYKSKGVEVYLAHPPFNPDFYDSLAGSPYAEGLRKIEALTKDIASRHGLKIIGSFNPHDVGCTAEMYIDAEHANDQCLGKIFAQFEEMDLKGVALRGTQGAN